MPVTMIRGFPNNFGGGSGIGGTRGASSTAFDVLEYPCVFTFKVIGRRYVFFFSRSIHIYILKLAGDAGRATS